MAARRELLERMYKCKAHREPVSGYYALYKSQLLLLLLLLVLLLLLLLRTNQKRMEVTLAPIIFPRDRNLRQLYAHCAVNTCLYPLHCAIIALAPPYLGGFQEHDKR